MLKKKVPYIIIAWVLLLISISGILALFLPNKINYVSVNVRPVVKSNQATYTSLKDTTNYIESTGILYAENPSFLQKTFFDIHKFLPTSLSYLFTLIVSIIAIRGLSKVKQKEILSNDIAKYFIICGYVCWLFFVLEKLRLNQANTIVKKITEGNFEVDSLHYSPLTYVIAGSLLFWIGKIFEKGHKVQQEQDLTV